jgi:membrane-associated phospholipid phosphatase
VRAAAAAAGFSAAVGVSRVYRDAHWLTDVVGGWLLGAVVAAGVVSSECYLLTPPLLTLPFGERA